MAKGRYNISVPGGSNFKEGRNKYNEAELENQECMDSCLSTAFLRSLSFHDRPRSSGVPINKELHKSRYKTLVSASLENIPSNSLPAVYGISEYRTRHGFGSNGVDVEVEKTAQSTAIFGASSQTDQNQLSVSDSWLEGRYTTFGMEAVKLLEQTVTVLRTVDKDISESLTNLVKPESIALESVIEIYKNKDKNITRSSAVFDLPTELSSEPIYENWQPSVHQTPKDGQVHSTPQRLKDLQVQTSRQNPKDSQAQSPRQILKNIKAHSAQQSPKNLQIHSAELNPKNLLVHSAQQIPKNPQTHAVLRSPKNLRTHSVQQSPKNLQAHSQQSPKTLQAHSQQSPKNLRVHSQQSPKNLLTHSQQSPKNLQSHSQQNPKNLQSHSQQNPKNLLVHSAQQTLKNLQSLLSSDSGNAQSSNIPDSDNPPSVEQRPKNVLSSPENTNKNSFIEFDLPSEHEQFVKIVGALQNRCLEYREMIQDVAVLVLEECLNFSELSNSRIRHLQKQFESQKRNFRDFKELCSKSVVFGPDSLPIDEKVTEVIQSFYLKLLQEENETFMARLEFGLKMAEINVRMLKFETESKKLITTLEKEILYLKKTSVGFKV